MSYTRYRTSYILAPKNCCPKTEYMLIISIKTRKYKNIDKIYLLLNVVQEVYIFFSAFLKTM